MDQLTRREFIRIASLMGGVSLFAGCSFSLEPGAVPAFITGAPAVDPPETLAGIKNIYSVCGLCAGNCGICCRVAEGKLVKIGGSPFHPASGHPPIPFETGLDAAIRAGGSICAIGGAGIQTLYDPFRVAVPLKRVGPRGSGKWQAMAWNDALNEIVDGGDLFGEGAVAGLKSVKESGEGVCFLAGRVDWGAMTFLKRFFAEIPVAGLLRDSDALLEDVASAAADEVFGPGSGPVDADYSTARFVLSFGDAPLDSGVPLVYIARQIADARVNGSCLKWAVVDPRLSVSASRADMWAPIVPGQDSALASAIAKALVDHHPEAIRVSRELAHKMVGGLTVQDLVDKCGVRPDVPVRLAALLAEAGPRAAVIAGPGILAQADGFVAAQTILWLNRLVGSIPGSGGIVRRNDEYLKEAEKRVLGSRAKAPAFEAIGGPARPLILWQADPVYSAPTLPEEFFNDPDKVPLSVAIDTHITESSALADYILPDTTYLERWDICVSPPAVTNPGFGVRVPVVGGVEPATGRYLPVLPRTRLMEDILITIAASLGLPGFGPDSVNGVKTAFEFYGQAVPVVFQCLKESGAPGLPALDDPAKIFERGGVFAASRPGPRVADGARETADVPKPVTVFRPSPADDDSLLLITYALPFHRSVRSVTGSWLMEILPENKLLINANDARRLKIRQSQRVVVESLSGGARMECTAHVVPGIRPGVVALARGFGARGFGASSYSVDNSAVPADPTRGAGTNPSALRTDRGPVKVTVKPA